MKSLTSAVRIPVQRRRCRGFTRLEALLLAVCVAVLVALQAPLVAQSGGSARTAVCEGNFRRLIQAWQMYADDHRGVLPIVLHGGEALAGRRAWASGWLDWTTSPANTNQLFLVDDRYSQLGGYLQRDASVFRCPADRFVSPNQAARGWNQRARSSVVNLYVGDGNVASGPTAPIYRQIRRLSDLHIPGPSDTWVHTEEHPDSMNDPGFFPPQDMRWVDLPAAFHDGAGHFTFADGHVTRRVWESSRTLAPVSFVLNLPQVPRGDPDLHWVSEHSPRTTERSY